MEATMRLENLDVDVSRRSGTRHGFAEPDGDTFDPGAFDEAWAKTLQFLDSRL
jgi:dienelactone hydrolase